MQGNLPLVIDTGHAFQRGFFTAGHGGTPMSQEHDLPESDAEWRERLTEAEYRILREGGTEPAFSGEYVDLKDDGVFRCAGCGTELFSSETKFGSGTGWPSFFAAIDDERIETRPDHSHGMNRIEILCARCGGHLGHVFDDGPEPTGKRYCVNSASLDFEPETE